MDTRRKLSPIWTFICLLFVYLPIQLPMFACFSVSMSFFPLPFESIYPLDCQPLRLDLLLYLVVRLSVRPSVCQLWKNLVRDNVLHFPKKIWEYFSERRIDANQSYIHYVTRVRLTATFKIYYRNTDSTFPNIQWRMASPVTKSQSECPIK